MPQQAVAGGPSWQATGSGQVVTIQGVRRVEVDFRFPPATTGGDARHIGRVIDVSPSSARALTRQALRYAGPAGLAAGIGLAAYEMYFADDDIRRNDPGEDDGVFADRGWRMTEQQIADSAMCGVKGQTALVTYGGRFFRSYAQVRAAYNHDLLVKVQSCLASSVIDPQVRITTSVYVGAYQPASASPVPREVDIRAVTCFYTPPSPPCVPADVLVERYVVYPYSEAEGWDGQWDGYPLPGISVPASDTEVDEAVANGLLAQIIAEAIRHGYAHVWPELAAVAAQLSSMLDAESPNYDAELDAATIGATTVAPIGGTSPGSSSAGTSAEWPGFCTWATIVCSFIDWFKADAQAPDDPDLPVVEVTDWDEVTVGGGSYNCPGATNLGSVFGEQLTFDWSMACNFVVSARPIILTVSIITSLLILVGWRGAS